MLKIGLLSDTHGYFDERMAHYLEDCNEVWHAGDFGESVNEQLEAKWKVRAVYGNIDSQKLRTIYPENNRFTLENTDVWMTHIGGYPGNYDVRIRKVIQNHPPDLFICGHSHILKIMPDKKLNLLHINPGAAGKSGFHVIRTMVRFQLHDGKVLNPEVIELGKRNAIE